MDDGGAIGCGVGRWLWASRSSLTGKSSSYNALYPSSSTPLAIVKHKDENVYKLDTFKLDEGRIYCFTDGFSECLDENRNEIGIDGVKKLLLNHQNSSLQKELENSAEEIRVKSLKKD